MTKFNTFGLVITVLASIFLGIVWMNGLGAVAFQLIEVFTGTEYTNGNFWGWPQLGLGFFIRQRLVPRT
jgi:hypothetical protein